MLEVKLLPFSFLLFSVFSRQWTNSSKGLSMKSLTSNYLLSVNRHEDKTFIWWSKELKGISYRSPTLTICCYCKIVKSRCMRGWVRCHKSLSGICQLNLGEDGILSKIVMMRYRYIIALVKRINPFDELLVNARLCMMF